MKRSDSFQKIMIMAFVLLLSIVCTTLLGRTYSHTLQDPRAALFNEVEKAKEQAQAVQADIFSPTQFSNALKNYQQADEDYKRGKNLDGIRKKIGVATTHFLKCIETTKLAKIHFTECINARNDALAAEAPQYRNEQWQEAESILSDAAKTLEKGDLNGAQSRAAKAEQLYRSVELEAIKANYLGETKTLLDSREKELIKTVPFTFNKAKKLIAQAERLLVENRYDTDEARQQAQQAKYEAQHAVYLAQLMEKMKSEDKTIESVLLDSEKPVQTIADEFDLNAQFHEGFDDPVGAILREIQTLKRKAATLEQDLADKEEQLSALSDQVTEMESKLGVLKSKEENLTQLMEQQRQRKEKFERVEKTFSSAEAQILREGDRVIIRLYGLTFPVGKATIESQYFGLLSKVIKAIGEYPEYAIVIEGHTDSRGGDETNLKLSTERANAVRDYLVAAAGIDASIIGSMGYGEANPIASNDTEEGRRKNRRITVVIHPKE
jgi:outer membrane protein OmpA-like peptidoglycan-associated protein